MHATYMNRHGRKPRILIFSQRNFFTNALFRASLYEFEDVISQVDSTAIFAPEVCASSKRHDLARRVAFHAPVMLNPGVRVVELEGGYDVFLVICGAPGDLLTLKAARNWKNAAKISMCLIDELWVRQMNDYRYFLGVLEDFDFVLLYYSQSVGPLSKRIRRPCHFIPPGVDTVLFSPYPNQPKRVIDVCSIGRRSNVTHEKLLQMAVNDGLFYLHDSISGDNAIDLRQHRALLARVAKRSRYFIVNPGLIDRPDRRGNQVEIGNRYFEGAASGTIMVGLRPNNGEFDKLFDWPDVVIELAYDSPDIDRIIHDLDRDPERQNTIRRTNVVQALLRHDWVYRWEAILEIIGLEPMPELAARKERIKKLAEAVLNAPVHC